MPHIEQSIHDNRSKNPRNEKPSVEFHILQCKYTQNCISKNHQTLKF
jgi:hypothetical protein